MGGTNVIRGGQEEVFGTAKMGVMQHVVSFTHCLEFKMTQCHDCIC